MRPVENARQMTFEQTLATRVDRDSEVRLFSDLLATSMQNVYVHGPRGVGKTFLTRLVYAELLKTQPSVFPFFLNATEFALYGSRGTGEAFPAVVLLQLISAIWGNLLHHPYSDLVGSAEIQKRAVSVEDPVHKHLRRLFVQLRYPDYAVTQQNSAEFSVSAIAQGGLGENLATERRSVGILPYEFMEYLDELNSAVLPELGVTKLVCIVDEANMMPAQWQEELLSRHVDIFTDRGMQFMVVASLQPESVPGDSLRSFDQLVELAGLGVDDVCDLLDLQLNGCGHRFSTCGISLLHAETCGNPRQLIQLAHVALGKADHEGPISDDQVKAAVREYREMVARCRQSEPPSG